MTKPKPCPICGKHATAMYLVDKYNNLDFGWDCGCSAYFNNDGVHDSCMKVFSIISRDDAVEKWNKLVDKVLERIKQEVPND